MNFTAKHFGKSDGSHLPVLMKMLQATDGPIMELGTGFFSTPFLHWMCNESRRKLVSYESIPGFWEVARNFETDFHKVCFIDDWDKLDLSEHWSIVFIDHAPGPRRNVEMQRMADTNCSDYVIVHDTEAKSDWHYNYSKAFPSYKYRYDYKKAYPETSVLSNFFDPTPIMEA